jgi:hypothetical protein
MICRVVLEFDYANFSLCLLFRYVRNVTLLFLPPFTTAPKIMGIEQIATPLCTRGALSPRSHPLSVPALSSGLTVDADFNIFRAKMNRANFL